MGFNLRRFNSPLRRIRKICPDVRPSDLDGATDEEAEGLAEAVARVKVAAHGQADMGGWVEVTNPYSTTPLVHPEPWYGGGTFDKPRNENFPGGGGQHISDEKEEKSTRGTGTNEDFTPDLRKTKIRDKMKAKSFPTDEYQWAVTFPLREWDDPEKVKGQMSEYGRDAEVQGKSVRVLVDDYDAALKIQRARPGTRVTRKRRGT
jgi:hypothetical protein